MNIGQINLGRSEKNVLRIYFYIRLSKVWDGSYSPVKWKIELGMLKTSNHFWRRVIMSKGKTGFDQFIICYLI